MAVFTSQKQCSQVLGIPIDILKKARRHPDAVGGINGMMVSGQIYSDRLIPWLEKHKEELSQQTSTDNKEGSLTYWKTVLTKAKALVAEIELEEAQRNSLNLQDTKALLKKISTAQSAMLISKLVHETPPRLLGLDITKMSVVMQQVAREVCELFQNEIDKWH